ncbi:hypothetical protein MMC20_006829 [Loxospora ochrophaea]|nr:hypothetical protein [Loxospora ochrophaea]
MENTGPPPSDGNRDIASSTIVAQAVTLTLAFILVSLRLFVKVRIIHKYGLDDWFVVLGLIFSIALLVLNIIAIHYGLGRHAYYVPQDDQIQTAKYLYISQVMGIASSTFTKISISIFLSRLFVVNERRKWGFWLLNALIIATGVSSFLAISLFCRPIQKFWNHSLPGECLAISTKSAPSIYQGAATALEDLVLAALPIFLLRNVNISLRAKAGICVLMGMGVFSAACVIVRTALLKDQESEDSTFTSVPLLVAVILEQNTATIAACIPTLKPLFTTISTSYHSTRNSRGYIKQDDEGSYRLRALSDAPSFQPHAKSTFEVPSRTTPVDARLQSFLSISDDGQIRKTIDVMIAESSTDSLKNRTATDYV